MKELLEYYYNKSILWIAVNINNINDYKPCLSFFEAIQQAEFLNNKGNFNRKYKIFDTSQYKKF